MKKKFTFCNLNPQMRLLGLLTLFFICTDAFSQTICRPVSQTNSAGGGLLCLGVDVNSPANAFDSAGLSTYATLSNGVAVAGCFAEETLTLNQTARAGDQVAIYIGTGNGLLDLSLLSNATVQAKNSGTNVGSSVALNSPLLNLSLLSGNTVAVAKFPITGDTNQIQIQVGGGVLALLTSLRVYDVRLEFAQPTVSGGLTQTVCAGAPITLTATPAAGTTLAWYSSEFSTTALAVGNTYTTPALTGNTTYYIGITRAAGCEGNVRVPVVLNVSNPVAPAYSNVGTTVCSTGATQQTTLSLVNAVPGTTYNWFSSPTGGLSLASGTTYSPTVPLGTTSFYVEASIGSCISPTRTKIDVVSTAVPVTPTVLTQSVTIQSGQNATLSATTTDVGAQLNWYETATGGTAVATNTATFTTPILTATKTYYVEAQSPNGNCVSATRVPVTVTVQPSALGGCLEASSQVTSQVGICLLCNATNPNFSVDGNPATAARLTIPANVVGSMQQTLQFTNPGKAGDRVDVDLELPGGLADVQLLSVISLATYNGATYNNDRVAINNPLITLQLLSGTKYRASITAGANFDRVEVRLGGVAGLLTNLDIYQAAYTYKAPAVSGNTTICSGTTTTLTAALAIGETINWYNVPTGGTSLASTASYTTPALTAPATYYLEVTRNGCVNSERSSVQVLIDNPVAPAVTPTPVNLCAGQTSTITVQAPVAGTTYNWYDVGGNLVFTGNVFTTPALNATTDYFVEGVIGNCSSPTRTKVTLNVNPLPAAPTVASSTVVIQSGQVVTLQVSNPVPQIAYDWYDVPTGGIALVTGSPSYTPSPALTADKTFYVVARNNSDCVSATRTAINVVVTPPAVITSCLRPFQQTISTNGLCIGCTAVLGTEGNSVDNDFDTATTLRNVVGVGAYIQQKLDFSNFGFAGDIIEVELGLPTGVLDIGALSYITLESYNGGTNNGDGASINNLLNVQLLGGNRFRASFVAGNTFSGVQVRLGGVASVLSELDIYGASFKYKEAAITGISPAICSGQSANLTATTTAGDTINWYADASGGTALATNTSTYNTGALTATTTFYIEAVRGICINSVRQPVTVPVLQIPTEANIVIASPIEATCTGTAAIAPTSTIAGATFRYYKDQNKGTEIVDGSVDGTITFAKDPITGVLSLTGLSASYNLYISAVNGGTCENVNGDLKQVTITLPSITPSPNITATLQACGSANLRNAITNYDSNVTYTFYNSSNTLITAEEASNITVNGVYYIEAQSATSTCPSARQSVTVTIDVLPTLTVTDPQESVNVGTDVSLVATSTGTVTWFNQQGVAIAGPPFTTGPLNTPGVYTYTVVATNGSCIVTATKIINVIDLTSCQNLTERVYATGQTEGTIISGDVTNNTNAVDGNPQTFSTITTGLGLLGVGTTWQNLTWPANIAKGTPVTVKLGSEYSLLAVGQNLSVVGTKNGVLIGTGQSVKGSLLNLLSGDNTYEFTFVPSDASGPQDYDGIRIISSSIASVAQNTKVFDAYYKKPVTSVTCTSGDIQDIFYGATDLGIGAATALVGVSDVWNIADKDVSTFATMYNGVGALAAADLTVQFKTPSVLSDTLRIVVSKPGTLLTVGVLTGFSVQRYLGNVAVGNEIYSNSSLLSIKLLPGNSLAMVLVSSPTEIYDRVRIRLGGAVGVLDFLRVHTVERTANTTVIGADPQNKITVCPGTDITLQIPEVACSTYLWYDAETGGNQVGSGPTFTVPADLTAGIYRYYVQPVRYGCQDYARGEVTVEVKASAPVNALTDITLNGGTTTSICAASGTVTLATSLSGTPVLTNPVYHWYRFDGTTSQLITGETTAQLIVNGLAPGTYTYFVGVSSDEFCETAVADRKQITFTILPSSTVNDITVDDVTVCNGVPASLTPSAPTLNSPVFTWYLDANKTQPITDGAVIAGVTYAVDAAGVLTATGLTKAVSPITYYVAVASANTCENLAGTLQDAVIIVSDPNTPTTSNSTQNFCLINAPTVANIQVNESNVIWYDAAIGGNVIASATPLVSRIYYGAATDAITGCESSLRLQVTVNVNDPGTPTLVTAGVQNFCKEDLPTFASVQFNQANIVWYTAITGGTLIPSNTALTTGQYFAAISDPSTGCESVSRLTVDVIVSDPGTPTLVTAGPQSFCKEDLPTFASIQTNETNIVWYTAITGGTLIPSTTALTTGQYFAAISDPLTGCESALRLTVDVIVNDPGTPTLVTAGTQNFCKEDLPTFASVQFNQANIVWYTAITGGTLIPSTTALTTGQYFAAISDPITGCESALRLTVDVIVNDPGTPTLVTAGVQNFCLANAPTFASIQTNETNIVWYTAITGGTLIPSTTALTTGQYFAAISDPVTGCESASRLTVDVIVSNPGSPTLVTAGTQNFCKEDLPTFASIQTNETNIVWYTAITGGTLISSSTVLTTGQYFAAIFDPATGCESASRLTVDVIVNDPGTPTLVTAGTQNFCLANAPTFASVQFNQTNIVWYTASTGGTVIAPTTALTTGQYFAAISDPVTGCESATRLTVDVIVSDPGTPILVTAGVQNFCLVNAPTFASVQFNQTNIVWYTASTGGTVIAPTTALTTGQYFAAISDPVTGCESATRLTVDVIVNDPGTPTLVTAGTQNFCKEDLPTFASIQTNETNIVWYTAITGGTLIPSSTVLTTGQYFAAILDPATGCESALRLTVDVIVNDPGTPTLVTAGTQNFCLANAPTFASVQFNQTNIVWYTASTGGTVIAPTTALTTGQYFAAISDPVTGCESASRLTVDVIVSDPGTPTLVTAGTQNFCLVNAPTFASVQFNQTNIVWYTALTGGTVIAPTTALTTGQYFAAISDPATGCESASRLTVDVNVTDPATPTTNAAAQTFCTGTNPTVANIQVNESNVVWYTTQTGGTALASTTALTTATYFGAIKDPATGCESSVRLQVAVTVGNTINPTTNNTAQTFCSVNAPTIANIQVNESNVTWFTAATGGTAIPAGTALTSGVYFGNIIDPAGCESSTRLQVTVTVVNPVPTPTTANTTQNFCTLNSPTVANIQVNEANVVWYNTATGGTAIPSTTALTTGVYYGAVSSAIGCENPARLAVTVNVNSPSVITTPRTTQTFCLSALPTLANILVNETNVVWYASATGGTPLANTTPLTATTYYAGSLANTFNGCDNGPRLGITIAFENDAAVQLATTDDTPCVFKGVTYSIANGKSNYVWTINGGTIISGGGTNDGSVTVSWSDIGPGTVTVAYVNNCDERTIKTLNVTVASCSDLTITHTVDNPTPNFGDQVTFTITVNNVGEGDFINTLVSDLLPSGLQLVSSSATSGTYDPATQLWTIPTLSAGQSVVLTIVAEVLPNGTYTSVATVETSTPLDVDASNNSASVTLEPICLTVYNEFTPNNDGKNDLFRIDCIESYPNNELKVFNRYGALVYSKAHYENDWNGTANVSGVINRGDMLPTGTYFYVITIGDGTVKKGWLSIMR
ncbi:Ig-like domain-containing protein [Flavobacterium sp. KACC 22763]|uniref:Ig-like domain-containing protein n=1 Tax=Flavobacterium sp. KACC 22763 TaxID=3025668 RepID=UPI0023659A21|nr:gliding motility-associated C-terminal domain-containing protein [Flavobacterium sp. KACC 22763]WDF65168.1 gliding motility-associated C-terminal domain-containing protein [Flavobacterium sp. KACC 22763]